MTAQLRPAHATPDPGLSIPTEALEIAATDLPRQAVALAEELLRTAQAQMTETERNRAEKLARMMDDPRGKDLTIALADQAFRSHQPARVAAQLSHLLTRYGIPSYMTWWERAALTMGRVLGAYLPSLVVPPLMTRLRQETRSVILPSEESALQRYLQRRYQTHTRLNLNQLGEAILGEDEARRRLTAYLDLLGRDDVEYISVKVSSIPNQLVALDRTVARSDSSVLARHWRITIRRPHHAQIYQPDMEEHRITTSVAVFQLP